MTSEGAQRAIHVLVIDDSAVVRQALRQLLSTEPDISVSVAGDALIADKKIRARRPDVVILDLELPRVDGLTWLRGRMATDPLPVIVCSAQVGDAALPALVALDEGALEVVPKPRLGVRDFLVSSHASLIRSIRAAASAHLVRSDPAVQVGACARRSPRAERGPDRRSGRPPECASVRRAKPREADPRVIALAASTGGPQALQAILSALAPESPPILVVQHMSGAFTGAFARRLDSLCAITVREARTDDRLEPGTALIAPGGSHLEVARPGGGELRVRLVSSPAVHGHRPSADVMFRSLARTGGARALGVLLTGMGRDGAEGLLALRRAGAHTLAESEESCVVFGMPRAAIEIGAAELSLPVREMAASIAKWAETDAPRAASAPGRVPEPGERSR